MPTSRVSVSERNGIEFYESVSNPRVSTRDEPSITTSKLDPMCGPSGFQSHTNHRYMLRHQYNRQQSQRNGTQRTSFSRECVKFSTTTSELEPASRSPLYMVQAEQDSAEMFSDPNAHDVTISLQFFTICI
ncbi:hypothetical protein M436DRAFT_61890 [Aureobasidium namibiae CBS 147.97]|uniref:Uncharacterized protein n=1 Tax=Aureobasidium namibiae CBS 147.97 TaxID=1043004 RepID=A0A074WV93_9PEZI|nr:uncharacterized protein M436DRAFT_61890 [Aureobasidium namibiae CBS 147.97]KEQ75484.1 hypothetical protein M436DRAFT_61890 [Aureobasidium namibiae CBS 147.97]